ncbi:MAG: flagellar biosynthesis protein FlhB [Oligoflexia bacterium]|nr:flagellar biosynthesis protein FlhB [Oligoflexia bacterium]
MAEENGGEEDDEKTEEPSQYRLEEFRSKGQVASSKELTHVILLFATLLTLIASTMYLFEVMSDYFYWAYSISGTVKIDELFNIEKFKMVIYKTVETSFKAVIPIFLVTACVGFLSQIMQIGFIFSAEVLEWKWERIDPIAGVQRLFSKKILFETAKSILKLLLIVAISFFIIQNTITTFTGLLHIGVIQSFLYAKALLTKIGFSILTGLVVIAIIDFAWEKYWYRQKLLLTRREAKEELKEKEGNPEIKQRIRAIQREMSRKRMMSKIPEADVIVSNPTHISVALKYDTVAMIAPTVVAKGADQLALKIREIAKFHEIPIVENVQLARTLYQTVKVGESIPRNLYKVVAEILAFVYKLQKKKKALSITGELARHE